MKLRLAEDRALRDAARAVLDNDVGLIKADVAEHGVASRVWSTGVDYARIMAEGAIDLASENRGKLSGGLALAAAGLAVWIYRDQIGDLVSGMVEGLQPDDADTD
jgi:acyl CoA:acetate/3-ketoacid CoA transferase alpha subunit